MTRIAIVRGPHKGEVVQHEASDGPFFRVRTTPRIVDRAVALLRGEPTRGRAVMYRVFTEAAPNDRDRADLYAAAWCEDHQDFTDRCPDAPDAAFTLRWVRFGPAPLQNKLEAGSPGTRESKWHLLRDWRQIEPPWLAACGVIAYGPIVEEFRHLKLTPMGVPMCRGCKRIVGQVEDDAKRLGKVARGERGAMN